MMTGRRDRAPSLSVSADGVPVFRPSMAEFKDFNKYIKKLEQTEAAHIGLAKVIPPAEWVARTGSYMDLDLNISEPLLQKITGTDGHFIQNNTEKEPMSVQEYQKLANSIQYCTPVHDTDDELESIYWKNLKYSQAIYGADVNATLIDKSQKYWNLSNLGTILDQHKGKTCGKKNISGVTTPYLYFGMWKTTFPWHTEDMDLYAINYLHHGAPKSWYCVPPEHGRRLERMASGFYPGEADFCPAFMRHKTIVMSPKVLKNYSIPVYKMTQNAGEFMITFPFSYHMGYNHGYNIAEAINFATTKWIDVAKQSLQCHCKKHTSVIFPLGPFIKKYQPKQYKQWIKDHPEEQHNESSESEEEKAQPRSSKAAKEKGAVKPGNAVEKAGTPVKVPEKRSLGRMTNNSMSTDEVVPDYPFAEIETAPKERKSCGSSKKAPTGSPTRGTSPSNGVSSSCTKPVLDLESKPNVKIEKDGKVVKVSVGPRGDLDGKMKDRDGTRRYSSDEGFSSADEDNGKPSTSKQTKQRRARTKKSLRVHSQSGKLSDSDSDDPIVCSKELSTIDLGLPALPVVKTPYWCGYCGDVFSTNEQLCQHLSIHTAMEPFRCETCGHRFSEKSDCESHILSYKFPAPLKCKFSPTGHFICRPAPNESISVYPLLRTVPCRLCKATFTDRFLLRKHLLDHQKGLVVDKLPARGRNSRRAASETPSASSVRSSLASTSQPSTSHDVDNASMGSSIDESYECDECPGVKFYTRATYNSHRRAHSGNQKFKCDCGAKMDKADEFREHMAKEHNYKKTNSKRNVKNSGESTSSQNSNSESSQITDMIRLIPNKTLQRKYLRWATQGCTQCDTCQKEFSSVYSLIRHQGVHTGIKPFECKKCAFKTTAKSELTRHVNTKHGAKQGEKQGVGKSVPKGKKEGKTDGAKNAVTPGTKRRTSAREKAPTTATPSTSTEPKRRRSSADAENLESRLARKQQEIDVGMRRSLRTILLDSQPNDEKDQKMEPKKDTERESRRKPEVKKQPPVKVVKVAKKSPVSKANKTVQKAKKVLKQSKINCPHCGIKFGTYAKKRNHVRKCTKKKKPKKRTAVTPPPKKVLLPKPLNTDDSDTEDEDARALRNNKLPTCPNCFMEFDDEQSLKYHSLYDVCAAVYRCELCGKVFTRKTAYQSHATLHKIEQEDAESRKKPKKSPPPPKSTTKRGKKKDNKAADEPTGKQTNRRRRQSSSASAMEVNDAQYQTVGGKRVKKVLLDDSASSEERDAMESPAPHRSPPSAAAPVRKHRRSSCEDPSSSLFNFGSMLYWNEDSANDDENASLQHSSASTQNHPHSEDLSDLAMSNVAGTTLPSKAAARGGQKSDTESTSDVNVTSSGASPRGEALSSDVSSSEEGRRKPTARRRVAKKMHPDFVTTTSSVKKKTRIPPRKAAKSKNDVYDLGGVSIPAPPGQAGQRVVIGSTGSISNIPMGQPQSPRIVNTPQGAQIVQQKKPVSILVRSPTAGSQPGVGGLSPQAGLSNVKLSLGPKSPTGGMGMMQIVSPSAGTPGQTVPMRMHAQKSLQQHLLAPLPGAPNSAGLNLLQSSSGKPSPIQHISIARSSTGNISVQNPSGVQIRSTGPTSNEQMIIIKKRPSGTDSMIPLSAMQQQQQKKFTPHISDVAAVCEIDSDAVTSGMSIVGSMTALSSGMTDSADRDDVPSTSTNQQQSQAGPSGIAHSRLDVNMSVLGDAAFRRGTSAESSSADRNASADRVVTDEHGYCKRAAGPAASAANLENVIDLL